MDQRKIKGREILNIIPDHIYSKVELSFQDFGMDLKEDIVYCELRITAKGTCWIHDTRTKTQFWNGTPLANYHIEEDNFWYPGNKKRNSEIRNSYAKKRAEFFKIPRTAAELDEFDKLPEDTFNKLP